MDAAWIAFSVLKRNRTSPEPVLGTSHAKVDESIDQKRLPPTPTKSPSEASPPRKRSKVVHKMNVRGTAKVDFSKPLDTSVVKGKTALVLDGATGLGFGIASALAENGAYVAMCDPNEEGGLVAENDLNRQGYSSKFFKTETSDWESQSDAFKQVLAWSNNQLDVVVTSPGIVTNNLLMSILPKHREPEAHPAKPPTRVLEIDLLGVYYSATLALFYFNRFHSIQQDPSFAPQLVFIGSMASYDGLDFGTDYAAAKHGVRAIWKTTRKPRPSMAQYQSNLLAPTYVNKNNMHTRSEGELQQHHTKVNELTDVVAGAMRCICDSSVEGRAIACVQGSIGTPGRLNFDLCDDIGDHNGGRILMDNVNDIWVPSGTNLSEESNCAVQ